VARARSAARVNHPNLCQIYEIGEEDGDPYLVMEKLEGESLADAIARHPFAVGEAVQVVLGMLTRSRRCTAAGSCIGISNLPTSSSRARVKLLDFGLARLFDPRVSSSIRAERKLAEPPSLRRACSSATPRYCPPRRSAAKISTCAPTCGRWRLVVRDAVGQAPFRGQTVVEIYHEVMSGPIPALGGSAAIAAVNR